MFYKESSDDDIEFEHIHFQLNFKDYIIISKVNSEIEFAIQNLQLSLPANVNLACCQSCKHGIFCSYGDQENEIFCFKDLTLNNRNEVCEIFSSNNNIGFFEKRSKQLLGFCKDYKPILNEEYYTYNDWYYYCLKNKNNK